MRRVGGLTTIMLSMSSAALARPATEAEQYYVGNYVVKSEDSTRTICRVNVAWSDDVGGEFASKGCDAVPALADSARWYFDEERGEARFEDPLHKPRFRLAETDAGFVAILPDESRYWFELPPKPVKARKRR